MTIKTRLVNLKRAGRHAVRLHLRYIERDGVTPSGGPGQAYGPTNDEADRQAFESRSREDRHQFRFIVSPEDAADLGDLRQFTRDLMTRMEQDLGTRLDWIAVDHWDTDNPHTHVVLRGVAADGRDLIIAREYLAHGMRERAAGLATEWLGPRTQRDIAASLGREVDQERWTGLDQALHRAARDGVIDIRVVPEDPAGRFRRSLNLGRLQRLQALGLAQESAAGVWRIDPSAQRVLRAMGERGDIIRTMQRAFSQARRDLSIFDPGVESAPVVGRIAAKGLADELNDRGYLVLDGVDGRAHYVVLPAQGDLAQWPVDAVVSVRGQAQVRAVDQTIAELADLGVYRTREHLALARAHSRAQQDPEAFVTAHVRRLEALRRADIVERIEDGVWRVPKDLPARGRAFDAQRRDGAEVELLAHLPVNEQVRRIGATWLDRTLLNDAEGIAQVGFGAEVRNAMRQRLAFLVDQGFADRRGRQVLLQGNLLSTLRDRELQHFSKSIEAQTGLTFRPVADRQAVSGIYRRSVLLASGRFAVLEEGREFRLVPWRPVMEQHLNQPLRGVMRGASVSWDFVNSRGPAL